MTKKCPMCGAPMESNVCGYCGYKEEVAQNPVASVPPQSAQPFAQTQAVVNQQAVPNQYVVPQQMVSSKNWMLALMLCIFLGVFGVHRFYVGKVGTGILYFFTCGLFGVGWIIDIIMIATGCFKDQSNLPLRG